MPREAPRLPRPSGTPSRAVRAAIVGFAFLSLLPLAYLSLPVEEGQESASGTGIGAPNAGGGPGPTAGSPPSWPPQWSRLTVDPDDGISALLIDVAEVHAYGRWQSEYLYVRLVTRSRAIIAGGGSIQLAQHSWWLYLDDGDGQNDWIVEERPPGSGGVCTLLWDAPNSDWGIGAGCDLSDTAVATDVGSAVRIVNGCSADFDCVDFALERSDYPGLGSWPVITGASDKLEDLGLAGGTVRNPTDGIGGCNPPTFDDCTSPVGFPIQIPEFPTPAVAAAVAVLLLVARRHRASRTSR